MSLLNPLCRRARKTPHGGGHPTIPKKLYNSYTKYVREGGETGFWSDEACRKRVSSFVAARRQTIFVAPRRCEETARIETGEPEMAVLLFKSRHTPHHHHRHHRSAHQWLKTGHEPFSQSHLLLWCPFLERCGQARKWGRRSVREPLLSPRDLCNPIRFTHIERRDGGSHEMARRQSSWFPAQLCRL